MGQGSVSQESAPLDPYDDAEQEGPVDVDSPGQVGAAPGGPLGAVPGGQVDGAPVAGVVEPPPVRAVVDYQIGGAYPPAPGTGVVIRDRESEPVEGVYSVCYVNAFQAQPHEVSFWQDENPDLLLRTSSGEVLEDSDWGEPLLDISTAAKRERLARIVGEWTADCARRGFRAVEADNLDSWTRSGGRLTAQHATEYARLLVDTAHAQGLAVAQKNAADLSDAQIRRAGFDFAIAEECQRYTWGRGSECDRYRAVYGDRVIEIEYSDGGEATFVAACRARGDQISVLLRDRDVVPRGERGYVNRTC